MKTWRVWATLFISAFVVSGIQACTAIGAGAGAATGAAVSHGDPAATVGGAVVGGVIGHEMK
jgi:osmotically inducible lipoprotein OsmB